MTYIERLHRLLALAIDHGDRAAVTMLRARIAEAQRVKTQQWMAAHR